MAIDSSWYGKPFCKGDLSNVHTFLVIFCSVDVTVWMRIGKRGGQGMNTRKTRKQRGLMKLRLVLFPGADVLWNVRVDLITCKILYSPA